LLVGDYPPRDFQLRLPGALKKRFSDSFQREVRARSRTRGRQRAEMRIFRVALAPFTRFASAKLFFNQNLQRIKIFIPETCL
jgi:hypothetical protein